MRSRIVPILVVALMVATMLPIGSAGAQTASGPVGEEFQITTERHSQNQIELWGDTVVYTDHRTGNPDVYAYDLLGGSEMPVSVGTGTRNNASVYGDIVVYMDKSKKSFWDGAYYGDGDIWGYNMATGERFPICTAYGIQCNPFIWGDKVVWVDKRNTKNAFRTGTSYFYQNDAPDIYGFDLSTGEEFIVSAADYGQFCVSMHGSKVAFISYQSGNSNQHYWDIVVYDLETGETITCAEDRYCARELAIWGDKVIWKDGDRSGSTNDTDLMCYDISEDELETVVTGMDDIEPGPDIWRDLIVFSDDRGNPTGNDLYLYDLSTGVETTLCAAPLDQSRARIFEDLVVWVDERNSADLEDEYVEPADSDSGNADVYGMRLSDAVFASIAGTDRYATSVAASK